MAAIELKRDSALVAYLAENKIEICAECQISVVDVKPNYTNIAIQDIYFEFGGKEYHMDHVWLQERDYPKYMKHEAEEYAWYEIYFEFYKYRDKIDVGMHGLDVIEMNKID